MNSIPPTLESLAARVTALEQAINENHESHGGIYARLESVEKGHAVLDNSLTNIWTVLKEIQADVKEMKDKPGQRWNLLANEALKWLIIAAMGAMVVFNGGAT